MEPEYINRFYIDKYLKSLVNERPEISEFRHECEKRKLPVIQAETAGLIKFLIKITGSTKILEVGTNAGFSAVFMADIIDSDEGLITTIERNPAFVDEARKNIIKYKRKTKIEIISGDASEVLENLQGQYDIIFFDGAKSKYKKFLDMSLRMLKPGGLIISDNVLYKGMIAADELVVRRQKTIVRNMREYLEYICSSGKFTTSVLPLGDGVAVSMYHGEENE